MAKWTLTYEGDCNEDSFDLKLQSHAYDLFSKIAETKNSIRTRVKYAEDVSEAEGKFLEELRAILYVDWDD